MSDKPFWKIKNLSDFTVKEWESICYRCGLCCLNKLQDETTNEVYYTRIICHLFDCSKHICTEYKNRCSLIPSCLKITPQNINSLTWMPKNCAYRILNETGDLPKGHPLTGGSTKPSLPNNLISDKLVDEENMEDYIIEDEEL